MIIVVHWFWKMRFIVTKVGYKRKIMQLYLVLPITYKCRLCFLLYNVMSYEINSKLQSETDSLSTHRFITRRIPGDQRFCLNLMCIRSVALEKAKGLFKSRHSTAACIDYI